MVVTQLNPGIPRAALVTGAGRRIGRTIASTLAQDGFAVALHCREATEEAEALRDKIAAGGGRAVVLRADLGKENETQALAAQATESLGPVGVLVNNASLFERDEVSDATRESWDAHMAVNLRAPFVLTQAMAQALPAEAAGVVINLLDQRVWNMSPHFVSYSISKYALWGLTQSLALALAPRIRVNGIGPGPALPSARQTQDQFDAQCASLPLRRGTDPDEIAATVRYILAAPAMTGQMIALDGGQHLAWRHTPDAPDLVE